MKKFLLLLTLFYTPLLSIAQPLTCDIRVVGVPFSTYNLCLGDDQILTGNGYDGTGPYTYLWSGGAGQLSAPLTNQTVTFTATTIGTFTVNLQVTDANSNVCNTSITINVNPLPSLFTNVIPASQIICLGDCAILTASTFSADTLIWFEGFVGGDVLTSGESPISDTVCPAVTTNYYAMASFSETGCVKTKKITITVIKLIASASALPSTICLGQTSQLLGIASGGIGPYSFSWDNASTLSDPSISNPIATPTTTTTYTYTVTDLGSGCTTSASVTVIVITDPPTGVTAVASPNPVCEGNTLTLTGNGTNATTWSWTGPDGFNSSSQSPTIPGITGLGSGIYTLVASNICGIAAPVNTLSVVVTPLPTAIISYTGSPWCVTDGIQVVTLSGTNAYAGGAYTSTPAGLGINSTTGTITPSASSPGTYTVTYTIPPSGGCPAIPVTTSVTITPVPTASISYASPFCITVVTPQAVTLSGTGAFTGGTYTSTPAGLDIDNSSGAITPGSSTPGTYTITYSIPASGGCAVVPVTTSVTISPIPTASTSYNSPFCITVTTPQDDSLVGTGAYTGGVYTSSPSGLNINPSTGAIIPSASTDGTYTVTYTIPASGGCPSVPVTTSVTITPVPTASISYATPFCLTETIPQAVTLSGTGAYTGGTFTSSPAGLNIDPSTGAIIPSASTPGTYTVTYTIPASGGCPIVPVTTSVTVTPIPTASTSYNSPFCITVTTPQEDSLTGTGAYLGGVYTSSPAGLNIDPSTGAIIPSASTDGTYTVTYTIPAFGGCPSVPVTTSVTITPVPTANISYATPFCMTEAMPQAVTLGGTGAYTGGTYTSSPSGLNIDPSTGDIIPGASTPGTYTVTYTIPASGGCPVVPVTTSVTVTPIPTATITYASPFCITLSTSQAVTLTGTGAYTGGTYTSAPGGLNINPSTGAIIPSSSTAGTYTVTYTIPASGGCGDVPITTSVTITPVPTASISYASPFCMSLSTPQAVTLGGTGAYTGGTYTSTPSGLNLNTSTGAIIPSSSTAGTYTVTYTIPASGGCAAVPVTTSVTITPVPTAIIIYSSPFCMSISTSQSVTLTGTGAYTGGTYSSTPAGLNLDPTTGAIIPGSSTAGIYTVTYSIPASGGCAAVPVTTTVTITAVPTAGISYASPFCMSLSTPQAVTLVGTGAYTGGTYTSTPSGLNLNSSTGAIIPSSSTAGTYTVTYTIPASGGCAAVPVTTSVTITAVPTAIISYTSPFCMSLTTSQPVTLTGTGAYTGGTYSSTPVGLNLDPTTGAIIPNSSTAGIYTVTYTIPASGGCAAVPVTTTVTITAVPTASISYTSPFCMSLSTPQVVTLGGTGAYTGGTYNSTPSGLNLNASSGSIIPSSSTAGTYTVTYTIPASGGCAAVPVTTSVTITAAPTAIISYFSPFCMSISTSQSVTLSGTGAYTGGTYSSTPAGLNLDPTTGAITPSSSTAGTYTVTYTIPASGGCAAVPVTTTVTITSVPTASITYASPFCMSLSTPQAVTLGGTGAYTGGTYSSTPSGLNLNASTGAIIPSMSTAGTYTITYTIPASGGCAAVPVTTSVTINSNPIPTIGSNSPFCEGGSILLTSGGGNGYLWSGPNSFSSTNQNPIIVNATAAEIGTYTVIVTGANGCTSTASINVTMVVVNASAIPTVLCFGQQTMLSANGAANYIWTPGGIGGPSITVTPPLGTTVYTVTGTLNGCTAMDTVSVTVNSIPTSTFTASSPLCNLGSSSINYTGDGLGSATYTWNFDGGTATPIGGLQNYTVSWPVAGIYDISLTVTQNNCPSTTTTHTVAISNLSADATIISNVSCYGLSNAAASVTPSNGLPPYTYQWNTSPVQNTQNIGNLPAGTYVVTISDSVNCFATDSVVITQPPVLNAYISELNNVSCFSGTNGSATVFTSGGTSPYTYQWSNGTSGTNTDTGLIAGTYTVTVTDVNTCDTIIAFSIDQPTQLVLTLTAQDEICLNSCNGQITANVTGGIIPYQYQWSNSGSITNTNIDLCAGNYGLTVTDSNSCQVIGQSDISTTYHLDANAYADPTAASIGQNINFYYTGSTAFSYNWDFGDGSNSTDQNPVHAYSASGTYTVTITISSGAPDFCEDIYTLTVVIDLRIPNCFSPNDDGINDVFVISGISNYPDCQLSVYNRWGNLVYRKKPYDNSWDATPNAGIMLAGKQKVQPGTYYYVLEFNTNDLPAANGYIVVQY